MAQNERRIRVRRLKIIRIAHFSRNFLALLKWLKIGLKMGCYLENGVRSKKTDAAIELAVSENPILDTSRANLRQKFFLPKFLRRGYSSWIFSIFDHFQKIRDYGRNLLIRGR